MHLRTTALPLSMSHLVLITRHACQFPSHMDWIDQSLSAAEEHMSVLREVALASEAKEFHLGQKAYCRILD
ncbi:transmembrane protein 98 [Crotalus adamanteus]|uniref:Transmembrane protein 98 n=1 Tax=Crotalus adamanteus TaxID=8729 RepID=A0AAW1B528_CROAD